ncbi:dUTP diphosphatase [Metabacillus herbersteinensis]|uniref:dUTP diphosphatase n=1 Tax=Metabacillus herbersteinensis TaxID=283816 RepID=A0ABV6GDT3_9BACI
MNVKIKRLSEHAVIPKYAKQGDSGFDLVAIKDVIIEPGETKKIPVGLAFEIPEGYELQIRPRSGITSETKLRVQFGTVDSGYRGEVSVTVDNIEHVRYSSQPRIMQGIFAGDNDFNVVKPTLTHFPKVNKGDRIAQGVIAPVIQATFEETNELNETERGENGHGSTGIKERDC